MQDYQIVARKVTWGNTLNTQDGGVAFYSLAETRDYIRDFYLSKGYSVLKVDTFNFVADNEQDPNPKAHMIWHLVADSSKVKEK